MPTQNPSPPPEDRSGFLELLALALERIETEGSAGFERLCREHAAHADTLRKRVGELQRVGLVRSAAPESFPGRLGEFRLLARIGEGGMGVVYLAEQTSLKRRVALKLVRPDQIYFAGARERFRREVEAVARLRHPGIVPVHTFGEEGGVPYYAMEHVVGATLADVIGELSDRPAARLGGKEMAEAVRRVAARTCGELASAQSNELPALFSGSWVTAALRIACQVAGALQHAHDRGVLHRDVKPSNVLVTLDGRALLFDFGLASSEGSERLTRTGGPLGSVAYMSPEQACGEHDRVGPRSDVYGLGVTLYELLALRAPFAESSVEATRQAVLLGRPRSLRELNPAVSRDVETLCLAAMDPDPSRRYASPKAFAADLANVLELRPIQARRPSWLTRAQRFAQRNPAGAAALVLGFLLFVGGPVAFALQQKRSRDGLAQAFEREKGERERAERNLDRAREAVDLMLTRVVEEQLERLPGMEEVRRELLGSALAFYEQFLAERGSDPALRIGTAEAAWRVCSLYRTLGRNEEALVAGRQSQALLATLRAEAPDDVLVLDRIADAHSALAVTLGELGRVDEALREADAALAARLEHERLAPGRFEAVRDLYESHNELARLYARLGRDESEDDAHVEASRQADRLLDLATTPQEREAAIRAAVTAANNLGLFFLDRGRLEPAADALAHALDLARLAPDLDQAHPETALSVLVAQLNHARLLDAEELVEDADAVYLEVLPQVEEFVRRFPGWVEARRNLAASWDNYALLLHSMRGRGEDAEQAWSRAVEHSREVVRAAPDVPHHRSMLAVSLVNQAGTWRERGERARAREGFEEAAALARSALAEEPEHPRHAKCLHSALWFLSLTCIELGDHASAIAAAEEIPDATRERAQGLRLAGGLVALASRVAGRDESLEFDVRALAASDARRLALELLTAAADAGLTEAEAKLGAPELDALRGEPGFDALIERVRANAVQDRP